ncbi:MAG: hypothetical protein KJO42_17255 [Silicimonas sp.]|nr:hypothetical protein [Silicimonas sp.]
MSSAQSDTPNKGFQSRLNRVAERRAPLEAEKPEIDVLPDWRENAFGPAGLVAAVIVGLVSVVIVRVVRFHFQGIALVSDSPDITMATEFAAALMLSFLIFLLLPWKGVKYRFLQFGGVALMALTMHNMVHNAPGLFNLAFSPAWTNDVLAKTEPGSMYIRGQSIPFAGKIKPDTGEDVAAADSAAPETPALPRLIQIGQ